MNIKITFLKKKKKLLISGGKRGLLGGCGEGKIGRQAVKGGHKHGRGGGEDDGGWIFVLSPSKKL